ncbi:hypothetical protein J3E73DRAFT_410317 [Bipolaris maydis]|nr:hypothetical protein J3E73DRAFT_410317 [Bipolaris maydis]
MSNELPACQKCKLRKVRCDRQAPKCTSCTKGNVACIVTIRQLEGQEAEVKARLDEKTAARSETSHDTIEAAQATPAGLPTGGSHASHDGFVGHGSGLGFFRSILSEAKWQRHRTRILDQLATRPGIQQLHLSPNPLPAVQEAEQLLENYFTRFHIHHTSLLRQEVLGIFNRVYNASATSSDQDYFRLLMVFAISATTRYRAGITNHHPYDYFIAAEDYLGRIPLIRDIDVIQNLLLLCMRQCIEWKLHLKPVYPLDPLVEQHRRRVFWECYVLDRYSSGILGRPFAIAESDIELELPFDADDDYLVNSSITSLDLMPKRGPGPSELSVFIICIQLRRISSRIHSTFYSSRSAVASNATSFGRSTEFKSIGHVYTAFTRLRSELNEWRATAPIFLYPRSLYERPEWHDFLHEKDVLLLARGAVHNVPSKPYVGTAVKEILTACFVSASRIIELYSTLMEKRAITWTRSYFQVIFTAGLTVTFCISLELLKSSIAAVFEQRHPARTLTLCSTIMSYYKGKMPDAASAAVVFDVLKDECLKDNLSRFNLSLTNNLMTQLEAGLGEYAWGSLPLDCNFWDQMSFNY